MSITKTTEPISFKERKQRNNRWGRGILEARKMLHLERFRRIYGWIWSIVRLLLILGLGYLILNPVIVKLSVAFKDIADYNDPTVLYIPKHFTVEYIQIYMDFIRYWQILFKSILFTSMSSILQTMACTLVAYGIARFHYRGRGIVTALIIASIVIPSQTVLIPLYIQFKSFSLDSLFSMIPGEEGISLLNTYWPFIILSFSGLGIKNGLFIMIFRQHFKNMPKVLEEAAYIDGCGPLKTFIRIMMPLAVPMVVTVFLFSFVWVWNDNYYTSFFGQDLGIMSTALNGIGQRISYYILGSSMDSSSIFVALYSSIATLLHMVPLILLYAFAQKYFVQSIERSGIVG
jgi:multiple sugar transport system permease protein